MDRVCPLLGLAIDRRAVIDGVDGGHRCHAESPPTPLEHRIQAQRCLTPAHERCERLLAYLARGGALPGSGPGEAFVATRLVLAPEPVWRGMAGRARGVRRGPAIVAGAATVAVVAAGVALGAAVLDGRVGLGRLAADATAVPVASGAAAGSRAPLPSDTARAAPSRTPAAPTSPSAAASTLPTPTPIPSPAPTPVPASSVPPTTAPEPSTYTVVAGDTLASIAEAFGTTVEVLRELNGIADPDEIIVGQVLVLP